MRHSIRRLLAVVAAVAFVTPHIVAAQDRLPVLKRVTPAQLVQRALTREPPAASAQATAANASTQSANETFNELQDVLNALPPNVRQVLSLDPSLLESPDYLAPYPRLAAFLQQHPEVTRNASFFIGRGAVVRERDPKTAALDALEAVLAGAALFTGIMIALWMFTGLLRQALEYRRWLRQSRVQAEAAAKVLDRLSSNEDLLAYLQTPAGMSLVQAAPVIEAPRALGLPFGRILWSVQAGIVLAAFGIGLRVVQGRVMDPIAPAFAVAGIVAFCVGIGFVASAAIAWIISSRLNLFAPKG